MIDDDLPGNGQSQPVAFLDRYVTATEEGLEQPLEIGAEHARPAIFDTDPDPSFVAINA